MPSTPRTPLAQISTNREPNTELTPYERGIIIGLHSAGLSHLKIGAQLGLSPATIQSTIEREKSRPIGLSVPRTGRPLKYTLREN